MKKKLVTVTLVFLFISGITAAQDVNVLLKEAAQLEAAYKEPEALVKYRQVIAINPIHVPALCKCSELCGNIGNRQSAKSAKLDYYNAAKTYADIALKVNPNSDDANFVMSVAMGRRALIESGKAKVQAVKDIKRYADNALRINPKHARAWHVQGKWHYEVSNLNTIERTAARILFGALPKASLAEAISAYEKCNLYEPGILLNYLELARAYKRNDENDKAIATINTMLQLPNKGVDAPDLKAKARKLLEDWK
jgi:tetratricopeptide (TPR) repeat protein